MLIAGALRGILNQDASNVVKRAKGLRLTVAVQMLAGQL